MISWRRLAAPVHSELVQALRTRETWIYLLGPAAVWLPIALVVAALVSSAWPPTRVAIPAETPLSAFFAEEVACGLHPRPLETRSATSSIAAGSRSPFSDRIVVGLWGEPEWRRLCG